MVTELVVSLTLTYGLENIDAVGEKLLGDGLSSKRTLMR